MAGFSILFSMSEPDRDGAQDELKPKASPDSGTAIKREEL